MPVSALFDRHGAENMNNLKHEQKCEQIIAILEELAQKVKELEGDSDMLNERIQILELSLQHLSVQPINRQNLL